MNYSELVKDLEALVELAQADLSRDKQIGMNNMVLGFDHGCLHTAGMMLAHVRSLANQASEQTKVYSEFMKSQGES